MFLFYSVYFVTVQLATRGAAASFLRGSLRQATLPGVVVQHIYIYIYTYIYTLYIVGGASPLSGGGAEVLVEVVVNTSKVRRTVIRSCWTCNTRNHELFPFVSRISKP